MKDTSKFLNPIRNKVKGRMQSHFSGFLSAFIVAILVMFQFGLIIALPFLFSDYSIYLYFVIIVLSLLLIVSLVNDQRSMSYKMSWVYIVLLLPISGHIMYALWGTAGSTKKIERTTNARINHGFTFLAQDVYTLELYNRLYPSRFRMAQYMLGEGCPVFKNNEGISKMSPAYLHVTLHTTR